jgi:coenzyme PQQ precursor peptide PqqA
VETVRTEWVTPEFDEIGCAPEVTMYVARMED